MSSAIEDLHEAVFGFRPPKKGEAYERLAAVVFAVLGWQDVKHNTIEHTPGKRAKHQLDVTARHLTGEILRLIAECKDWHKTVGKATVDALVGVLKQTGADAGMVVTTKGFTKGAINVAVDEDVALVLLTPFSENPINYVKTISLEIRPFAPPEFSNFDVELMPDHGLAAGEQFSIQMSGDDRFRRLDGTPAETLMEVLQSQAGPPEEGIFRRRAGFEGGRLATGPGGSTTPIMALTWTETSVAGEPMVTTQEAKGEPLLVLQQLDEHGQVESGRVVVDRDLFAWDIGENGNITPRGPLTSE